MLLLVIGLVAVIFAVLVAVFLVTRRRGDDDEPGGRQTVRDRLRGRARDTRWSTDPRMARNPAGRGAGLSRRPAGEPRGYGGPDRGYEPAFDQSRGYEPSPRGYGDRPVRSREGQPTERLEPARRGPRYHDVPEPAAPVGARVPRAAAPARRPPVGMDTGPGAAALYDTGPSAADFATTRINADPDLADSDVFPRVRADMPETEARERPKNQAKGRGRPSRGRRDDDDDDWPSTEWDKLSDEQYWAELSADKPLATTARSAQPSSAAPAAQPARAAGQPSASGRAASRPAAAPDAGPDNAGRRQPADRPGLTGSPAGYPAAAGRRGYRSRPPGPGRPASGRGGPGHRATAGQEPAPARRSPARRRPVPGPGGPWPGGPWPGGPWPGGPWPGGPGAHRRRRPADQPVLRAWRSRRRQQVLPGAPAQRRPEARRRLLRPSAG